MIDDKFVAAVKRMESRTTTVRAAVIVDPSNPDNNGRIVISYPRDGAGRLNVIAWLPGAPDAINGREYIRHHGAASGYGYDKASAAVSGAAFFNLKTQATDKMRDSGCGWEAQLRDAGYLVITAV